MGVYVLGNERFETSDARDRLASLRTRFMVAGLRHRSAFLSGYDELQNADAVFAHYPSLVEAAVVDTVSIAASEITSNRVYSHADQMIREVLKKRIEADQATFERVHDRWQAIVGGKSEREQRHAVERDERTQVIGGGFGVQGAIQGMVVAGAANAAIGVFQRMAQAIESGTASLGDKRRKQELYNDPATRRDLADFLCRLVLQGYHVVADLVNSSKGETVFETVAPADRQTAKALLANVRAGRVPDVDQSAALRQALGLDPFDAGTWRCWIDVFADESGQIARAAAALGIGEVDRYKTRLIKERQSELPWATPEQCHGSGLLLERRARNLGVDFAEERRAIAARATELDRQRRTIDGVEHDSLEEAEAARRASERGAADLARQIRRTVNGHLCESDESTRAARDDHARTVAGTLFDTVEQAERARRDQQLRNGPVWFLILFVPIPCALITLKVAFTREQRIFAICWMTIWLLVLIAVIV